MNTVGGGGGGEEIRGGKKEEENLLMGKQRGKGGYAEKGEPAPPGPNTGPM